MDDTLFDLFAGEARKDAGQAAALTKHEEWQQSVKAFVINLRGREKFTAEHVVAYFGLPTNGHGINKNNAVGAIMTGLAKRGYIRKTGDYVKSSRPERHGGMVAVWERTLLGKEPNDSQPHPVPVPTDAAAHTVCRYCGESNGDHADYCSKLPQHTCHPSGLTYDDTCAACRAEAKL